MKNLEIKTTKALVTLGACLLTAGSSWGAEVWLRAAKTDITLPGRTQPVTMWGFAQDSSGTTEDGAVTVPGPTIVVPTNDPNLTIHLKNYLPEPVSIVIPGQLGATMGDPVMFTDASSRQRAASLTHQAAPVDNTTTPGTAIPGIADYVWTDVQPGTYLYHSGSHMAVQVKMGLYGAMTKLESIQANNMAYQGVPYRAEATLVFSEVDVDLNDAVNSGNYGPGLAMSSTIKSEPEYFLINGKPYTPGQVPTSLGLFNQNALLRLINAGQDTHIPVLGGLHLQVVAENGKPYLDRKVVTAVNLPALQTADARLLAAPLGVHAVYDRRLGLTDPANSSGGMLTYLAVGRSQQRAPSITIRAVNTAQTYPSTLNYAWPAGVTGGNIGKVTVTLQGLSHPRPEDLDILLVSPAGTAVLLMSDVGGTTPIAPLTPVTLTFDDAAATSLGLGPLASGTFKPSNQGTPDTFTGSAPAGPYNSSLSLLAGQNPVGTWRLFIFDDAAGPGTTTGLLADGWSLTIAPIQ